MLDISGAQKIDISSLKSISTLDLKPVKLDPAQIASFQSMLDDLKNPPKPTPAQIEANKPYAQIWAGGKMVGEVYKGGSCMTVSNAVSMKLQSFFEKTDDRDARASAIAKATGGTIKYV